MVREFDQGELEEIKKRGIALALEEVKEEVRAIDAKLDAISKLYKEEVALRKENYRKDVRDEKDERYEDRDPV